MEKGRTAAGVRPAGSGVRENSDAAFTGIAGYKIMTGIMKHLKIELLKKVTASIFILLSVSSISCNKKQKTEFTPEPADPDSYDMSVWGNIKPGPHSGFGSMDVAYSKSIPPGGDIAESIKLHGWKGERVNCMFLVWSAGMAPKSAEIFSL